LTCQTETPDWLRISNGKCGPINAWEPKKKHRPGPKAKRVVVTLPNGDTREFRDAYVAAAKLHTSPENVCFVICKCRKNPDYRYFKKYRIAYA
jgi:hypothetical protein